MCREGVGGRRAGLWSKQLTQIGYCARGGVYVRKGVVKPRKRSVRRGEVVREQSNCKLLADVWEVGLVVIWSSALDVIEDSC